MDCNILKQIYYTLIYPYLSYGIVWGCASNSKLNFLFVSSRIIVSEASFFAHARKSAGPYYKSLKWIISVYKFRICCLSHKIKNETDGIPEVFHDVPTPACKKHNYNTRFVINFNSFRPRVSTDTGTSSFKFQFWTKELTPCPSVKLVLQHL